jgi:hypothetical protein
MLVLKNPQNREFPALCQKWFRERRKIFRTLSLQEGYLEAS